MRWGTITTILALAVPAFCAEPPPAVDQALRARITEFYQLQVDGKFRQAEQLVAEDSKDIYYESKKPDLKAFSIGAISYSPDFRTAKVRIVSKMMVLFPGAPPSVMDVPFPSNWKIDHRKWCWYVDKSSFLETPFGRVNPTSNTNGPSDASAPFRNIPAISSIENAVKADRDQIEIDRTSQTPQTVTVKNNLPGPVTIQAPPRSGAFEVTISKPNLAANESTEVAIRALEIDKNQGGKDLPDHVTLTVQPTRQAITIRIKYKGQ
jgi:hypothetical protein